MSTRIARRVRSATAQSLLLAFAPIGTFAPSAVDPGPPKTAAVAVDSSRHIVTLRTGPWIVPAGHGGHETMMHDLSTEPVQQRFRWPVTGWLRAAGVRIRRADGSLLPRTMLHHLNVVNFGRRQLLYAIPERLISIGSETEDIRLPASIGVPVTAGMPMAINFGWSGESPEELRGVTIELAIEWTPANTVPQPLSVLPVHFPVVSPVANDPSFDLPAGSTVWSAEYAMPVSGRIIAAGGHEHDFGTGITLADVTGARPRELLHLSTHLDAAGHLLRIDRTLPGVTGDGIRVLATHRLRVTGSYDNRTGRELHHGAMVHLALLFAPDKLAAWPAVDREDPDWLRDVAELESPARGKMAMSMMAGMQH